MRRSASEVSWLAVLAALHAVPIWWFRYFPSQDGPAHLENASILLRYDRPEAAVLREYYTLVLKLDPNWFGHLILVGLQALLPALVAEKVLLTAYVIGLPLAMWYALTAVRPESGRLALLGFALTYSSFLHLGLYNFCLSLPLYFVVVGFWLRSRERFTAGRVAALAALGLLLFSAHAVAFVVAAMTIGIMAPWLACAEPAGAPSTARWARAILPLLALVPASLLLLSFVGTQGSAPLPAPEAKDLWLSITSFTALFSYRPWELWFGRAVIGLVTAAAVLALAAKVRHRSIDRWDGYWMLIAVLTVIFFRAPAGVSGGTFLNVRLSVFLVFALILWLATQPLSKRAVSAIAALAGAVTLAAALGHSATYAAANRDLEEYVSAAGVIEPGSTVLPLCYSPRGWRADGEPLSYFVAPFRHAAGYLVVGRDVVEFDNYEADKPYFPVQFRPERNPYDWIGQRVGAGPYRGSTIEAEPPEVDFLSYGERTGGRVDYVLLWDFSAGDDAASALVAQQLEAGYDRVFTSQPSGLMQLYRRRTLE